MVVIHSSKSSVFILIGELAVIHCLRISSSSTMFISKKRLAPVMRSFKGTITIYIEYSQPFILSTVLYIFLTLKFVAMQFYQRTIFPCISEHESSYNKFRIEAAVFLEQHRLYWNKSRHLKQSLFHKKNSFRIPSCLEQLLLPNNYPLVTNTFFDQLLLEE